MMFAGQENPWILFRSKKDIHIYIKSSNIIPAKLIKLWRKRVFFIHRSTVSSDFSSPFKQAKSKRLPFPFFIGQNTNSHPIFTLGSYTITFFFYFLVPNYRILWPLLCGPCVSVKTQPLPLIFCAWMTSLARVPPPWIHIEIPNSKLNKMMPSMKITLYWYERWILILMVKFIKLYFKS